MKHLIIFSAAALLAGCIGSSTNFTNRSITYQMTPSVEGKSNTVSEQPKVNDSTVNAEKTTETKANVSTGTSALNDNATEQPEAVKKEEK